MIHLKIVNDAAAFDQGFKRLLNHVFSSVDARACLYGQTWTPQMDIFETPEAYIIIAEMAGVKPGSIDIVIDQNNIQISGCREQPALDKSLRVHQMEISYGVFDRGFHLPSLINPEKASAAAEHGLVTIILPKETRRPTKIGIVIE